MKFYKYHALGNDYIVLDLPDSMALTPDQIKLICHRNYGIGSDGILRGPLASDKCEFGLRIFNPDGSEAEKSGNGLRIFSRYLWDQQLVQDQPFQIETPGGIVISEIKEKGRSITVAMGKVSFHSSEIPVTGLPRDVLQETMEIADQSFTYCAATVGNPHCVVLCDSISAEDVKTWGPAIEVDSRFPNRTNVQFMKILDQNNIQIEIWERGAGYTLASGSSSTAAAAVAHRLNLCRADIAVHMPGGTIQIQIENDYSTHMTGPVTKVCEGVIAEEMLISKPCRI
ncbi:MAG: diaminopimelate epimerase [SAR324 cluster bacterium]|nr:diaminopimelate epimerase [SAR324 cluster bacterium]